MLPLVVLNPLSCSLDSLRDDISFEALAGADLLVINGPNATFGLPEVHVLFLCVCACCAHTDRRAGTPFVCTCLLALTPLLLLGR